MVQRHVETHVESIEAIASDRARVTPLRGAGQRGDRRGAAMGPRRGPPRPSWPEAALDADRAVRPLVDRRLTLDEPAAMVPPCPDEDLPTVAESTRAGWLAWCGGHVPRRAARCVAAAVTVPGRRAAAGA